MEKQCNSKDHNLNVKFEFTARNTPQQNSVVDKGFDTLYGRGCAMMIAANIPQALRYVLFKEAFKHSTNMDNLVIVNINGVEKTRYEHFEDKLPSFVKALRTWGKAGVVTLKNKATPKVGDRGKVCIFVGYADMHASDCYCMFDPESKRVHTTRDVRWLKRWYFDNNGDKNKITVFKNEDEDDESKLRKGKSKVEVINDNLNPSNPLTGIPEETENEIENENKTNQTEVEVNDDGNEVETALPNPNTKGWTTVTRSGRYTKKPDLFNPETGNVFTQAETNYYQILEEIDEFDGNEVAAMAGSTIKKEIENIGTAKKYDNAKFDARHAYKVMPIKSKKKKIKVTKEEKSFDELIHEFKVRDEIAGIGAGIGGGFSNTKELHVMKYDEALQQPDCEHWVQAVKEEHDRFIKYDVFKPVKKSEVPATAKVLTTTCDNFLLNFDGRLEESMVDQARSLSAV